MNRRVLKLAGIQVLIAILSVFLSADDKINKVDKVFAKWDSTISPGVALAIIQDGEIIYKRGYGMANLEQNVPITSKTVFRIGSTSKQFTAACIAILSLQGKLSLDDDIRKYVPELPEYEKVITVRHLVHHTSGLRDYLVLSMLSGKTDDDFYSTDDTLEQLSRQKGWNFPPGEEHLQAFGHAQHSFPRRLHDDRQEAGRWTRAYQRRVQDQQHNLEPCRRWRRIHHGRRSLSLGPGVLQLQAGKRVDS